MPINLSDLLTPPTEDELTDTFLALLAAAGFPVTSWQVGGVARTMARLVARGLVKLSDLVSKIAKGGFNSYATGDWLTLLASEVYENERAGATFAQGQVQLGLSSALAGPYTFTPGQLWFVWKGKRYRSANSVNETLTWPDTLILPFKAESPGAVYNAPDNQLALETPLAGLVLQASSVTTQGTDPETDDSLRARDRGKWGTVGPAANSDGWATYAREASVEVTRVVVQENQPAAGSVRVVVAGSAGAISGPELTAVGTYLAARRPFCVGVSAVNASEAAVAVTATVRILSSHPNAGGALVQAEEALAALFAELPIGGTVRLGDLYQAIEGVAGVESSLISAPASDTALGATEVAVPTLTLTPAYV